jgi:hypothetical protein
MTKELAQFKLEDGTAFLVEVDRPQPTRNGSIQRVASVNSGQMVYQASQTLEQALDSVQPVVATVLSRMKAGLSTPADEIEVTFGLKLAAEAGWCLARWGARSPLRSSSSGRRSRHKHPVGPMTFEASQRAIAQIHFADSRNIAGTGFLVAEGYLLTCAHVVKKALFAPDNPVGAVLEVTFFNTAEPQRAEVIFYEFEEQRCGRDAAVLYLLEGGPGGITPAPLRPLGQYRGAQLHVFGYPNDAAGRNLTAVTCGEASGGWVQIEDTKVPGLAVEEGFSGAPVWCEAEGGMVGMVVARHDGQPQEKVGFMIPVQQLQAARQAVDLITTLNNLPPTEFEVLISTLKSPGGIVPPSSAAQGLRSSALLQWIEGPTGPGLNELQAVLGQVMMGKTITQRTNELIDVIEKGNFSTVKKRVLTNRLTSLMSQYEALNEQYDGSIDAQQKIILKSRTEKLEQEIMVVLER